MPTMTTVPGDEAAKQVKMRMTEHESEGKGEFVS